MLMACLVVITNDLATLMLPKHTYPTPDFLRCQHVHTVLCVLVHMLPSYL
jgi:hypothetical protein